MTIESIFENIYPLPVVSIQLVAQLVKEVSFPKGYILWLYMISSG